MKNSSRTITRIVFGAVLAAMVYVVTLFRFPLLGSKVHFANAVCLLGGLLLGPVQGGLAAGLGSALYDALAGGYDLANVLITFVSKFAMAWVCGKIFFSGREEGGRAALIRLITACVAGALSYVVLYMLKTFIFQAFVYGYPMDTVWAALLSKLPASLINAGAAVVATPIFYHALRPALKSAGVLKQLEAARG